MTEKEKEEENIKSTVKTYRPIDGSKPCICIHTKPSLMKKLRKFLENFDKPPKQLFLEFVFVEVENDQSSQFRYKLNHPFLNSIVENDQNSDILNRMDMFKRDAGYFS
jgi:hypothetical protein